MSMERVLEGVMVMKDGKGWGIEYQDGQVTAYGWIDPVDAEISDPRYCKRPESLTYKGSPHRRELAKGKLVRVRRVTRIEIIE